MKSSQWAGYFVILSYSPTATKIRERILNSQVNKIYRGGCIYRGNTSLRSIKHGDQFWSYNVSLK